MKLIINPENIDWNECVLTTGTFDGVHSGHHFLVGSLIELARSKDLPAVVVTFEPHPRLFFRPSDNFRLLSTLKEKSALFAQSGVEALVVLKFDEKLASLSAEEFIRQILVKKLRARYFLLGYDHHFGKDRSGNFETIANNNREFGVEILKGDRFCLEGENISSSKIRNLILEGSVEEASKFLGYFYGVDCEVTGGHQIGRKIGFPTANLKFPPIKLIPKVGVYAVKVLVEGAYYWGMMNIGNRPTIHGDTHNVVPEVHILDYSGDLYQKKVRVTFIKFIRDENKFNGIDELVAQLNHDREEVLFLKTNFRR